MRLISVCVLIFCAIQNGFCDNIIIKVQQGSLEGEILKTPFENKEFASFRGIPYAAPPVGTLRFKAPQDPVNWEGVWNATAFGNTCPQYNPITDVYTQGNEDCLFLNVYSPNLKADPLLPVIVFFHGGAYMFGSSSEYGPEHFMEREVLLVTLNYRLGVLGFLNTGTPDAPGNAGLKDQVAALKWVKNNIKAFGGDPNRVTIVGDTAGAHSVSLHLLSPKSKGLFQKAISVSGADGCDFALNYQPERKAYKLAKSLGFEKQNTTDNILTFLQNIDYNTFFSLKTKILAGELQRDVLLKEQDFTPTIERDFGDGFLTKDPSELLKSDTINKVDTIFGHSSQEGIIIIPLYNSSIIDNNYGEYREIFAPGKILNSCPFDQVLDAADKIKNYFMGDKAVTRDNMRSFISYSSSVSISNPVQRFARKWSAIGGKTFFFLMEYFTGMNTYGQQGVAFGFEKSTHFDIISYLFYSSTLNISKDSIEYQMIKNITTSFSNFAKTSDPSVNDIAWPLYKDSGSATKDLAYMTFGNDGLEVKYGLDRDIYNFWDAIYANYTCECYK